MASVTSRFSAETRTRFLGPRSPLHGTSTKSGPPLDTRIQNRGQLHAYDHHRLPAAHLHRRRQRKPAPLAGRHQVHQPPRATTTPSPPSSEPPATTTATATSTAQDYVVSRQREHRPERRTVRSPTPTATATESSTTKTYEVWQANFGTHVGSGTDRGHNQPPSPSQPSSHPAPLEHPSIPTPPHALKSRPPVTRHFKLPQDGQSVRHPSAPICRVPCPQLGVSMGRRVCRAPRDAPSSHGRYHPT